MSIRREARTHTLVVEDDVVLRSTIRRALDDAGFHPAPAVVICSAFGLANLIAARYSVPYVRKPFELDALVREVERAIEERLAPRKRQSG